MEGFAEIAEKNKAAKGPDFLSRLKGYLNIPALDHSTPGDPMVVIRRAILFRSMLERTAPGLFSGDEDHRQVVVDDAVARAFLYVKSYNHGARSMETIISMSLLDGKRLFEQSSLPSRHLLKVHVDADDFLALVREHVPLRGEEKNKNLEKEASAGGEDVVRQSQDTQP